MYFCILVLKMVKIFSVTFAGSSDIGSQIELLRHAVRSDWKSKVFTVRLNLSKRRTVIEGGR